MTLILSGCASNSRPAPVVERGKAPKDRVVVLPPDRYVIKSGDTLYRIAFDHGLDYRDLARWNGIANPDRIIAGSVLRLRPIDTPSSTGAHDEPRAVAESEDQGTDEGNPAVWIWPVKGKVIGEFNEVEGRKGLDIAAPLGTAIQAAAAGRVVYAGHGLRGYGRLTIIKHSRSHLSAYAHQSRVLINEGDVVAQGQKIGEVGDTDADRAKLHFEIRVYGRPVNPKDYLPS